MKRRMTYIARFWNVKPIRVSAVNEKQAEAIARGVAEKENKKPTTKEKWVFQSVGLAR